jgi:hypothetical protein
MADKNVNYTGIGFSGLLAIVFITLKLLKIITWSWLWVLAPLWIPIVLVIVLGIGAVFLIVWKAIREK